MKKGKKRKLTVLQRFSAAKAKRDAARIAAEEEYEATVENVIFSDIEKIPRVYEDPSLSPKERLEVFKSANGAWPRIVLGLYEAERAIAEKQKKKIPMTASHRTLLMKKWESSSAWVRIASRRYVTKAAGR